MSAEVTASRPSERAQHLLRVLIQRYIQDGQPVGSRTLSKDSGLDLSPATIRNVMSDLEDLGLVSAPHTSAGRIPTAQGYRLFVDTLVRYRQPNETDIDMLRSQIRGKLDNAGELMTSVSNLLSEFTKLAGVVTVPRGTHAALRQIEFLALSEKRILAIIVINDREVQNRILHTDRDYTAAELQQAANFINEHYAGVEMLQVRQRILNDLEDARLSMNKAMHDIIAVAQSAMHGAPELGKQFMLAGESNLLDFAELSDIDTLRRLFEAFSRKRFMLDLLDRSINADGVQVFIGGESGYGILDDCSVVTAPYRLDDETVGVLGVIGPKRMAYDRVVPIVDITARLLRSALSQ
ncbi:MAG: heat-inducible transcriptional repressor HrcA [Gammaproteobacteria bacterium]|nr:heat-inducible transcriptional repressor HrcA [Gammaproteobacteria bacterium]MDH5303009.1 heat-inducible transcriptional repressor HrcA [Gammaproteobacteria bacterium]MDH5321244.1 heat-inducible transcriptional repressor HrcA [Gammaproteobacteria bacterium]